MRLLHHIIEPKRLLMVWQTLSRDTEENTSKPQVGTGKRYIVGEVLRENDDTVALHYLKNSRDFQDAQACGFEGYPAFSIDHEIHRTNVMDALERRIPPRERTDFKDFLRYHRIAPEEGQNISEFALLGYTGAKLPGDGFSFVHTFEEASTPCEITTEVAGFRHYTGMDLLSQPNGLLGMPVRFKTEPENRFDPNAVAITTLTGEPLGHINRAQTPVFNRWLHHNHLEGTVERVNGKIDRPSVLLFVEVT